MTDKITYGRRWFRAQLKITEIWDEKKARSAHERRKPFAAALEREGVLRNYLEFNNDSIEIGFYDHCSREHLSYQFAELEPGRVFLSMAMYRGFAGETQEIDAATNYYFEPDGSVKIETFDLESQNSSTKETTKDLSGNWDDYPAFGDYQSITRIER